MHSSCNIQFLDPFKPNPLIQNLSCEGSLDRAPFNTHTQTHAT